MLKYYFNRAFKLGQMCLSDISTNFPVLSQGFASENLRARSVLVLCVCIDPSTSSQMLSKLGVSGLIYSHWNTVLKLHV